ncbi:hypothetical protein [Rhodopila sp.]|uniref:hypothetical protein n=1 Tax=Rhodopila sp. TaxID=2480087 RepID=UPI002CB8005C|nr:hypothetical protein [Rhodopila sp.]HVZ06850.1 hypothetical protein [Rhodopila sp.]
MRIRSIVSVTTLLLTLTGCAQAVQQKEDLLAASGFTLVPANTPQRIAAMRTLPPHKFIRQVRNDTVVYVYADPTVCMCIYIGNQAAYGSFREKVFARQITDEQAMTAQMNQMTAIDFGPWGPGWWY